MPSPSDATIALGSHRVHPVGFGAMQLPGPGVFGPPRDRDEAIAVLRRAVEFGVDHIDTAQYYGPDVANDLIREALFPYPDHLALVSKVGARRDETGGWLPANQPDELRTGVEDNLRSLGVDQLAAVNLRIMDPSAEIDTLFEEQVAEMVSLRNEGLIAGIGLSSISTAHLKRGLELTDIACVQNPLNIADRTSMPVLEACRAAGVTFVPFFPLGSGFAGMNQVLNHPVVTATAARLGVTGSQVAMAWLLARGPHVALIPGTSSVRHLEENMAAGEVVLDAQALRELDGAAA